MPILKVLVDAVVWGFGTAAGKELFDDVAAEKKPPETEAEKRARERAEHKARIAERARCIKEAQAAEKREAQRAREIEDELKALKKKVRRPE